MTDCLNSIRMEYNAFFLTNCTNLCNWLNGTDFVVGIHNGNHCSIFPNGIPYILRIYQAICADRQIRYGKAFLFQILAGVQNSMMLKHRSNQMLLATLGSPFHVSFNRPVVGF